MRTITKGDPQKIAEKMGEARNLASRNIAKQELGVNPQIRVSYNGIEVRLNADGIDQIIIDAPMEKRPEQVKEQFIELSGHILIYAANFLSAIPTKDLNKRSQRHFSSALPSSIMDILCCKTIVIVEPQRVLTAVEERIFNLLLDKGRNVFVFPGEDTTVYNAILIQLKSNLILIPLATSNTGFVSLIAPDETRYRLYGTFKGFLHPIDEHTLTADISDPFGHLMATTKVVSMTPAFSVARCGSDPLDHYTYLYGSELLSYLQEHENHNIYFYEVSYLSDYPHDWSTLTKEQLTAWIGSLEDDFFRLVPVGYQPPRDNLGYLTYEDKDTYDFMSSFSAYEPGRKLYVFGWSPYWLKADAPQSWDDLIDIGIFSKWMVAPQNTDEGALGSLYYPLLPYFYGITSDGSGEEWQW